LGLKLPKNITNIELAAINETDNNLEENENADEEKINNIVLEVKVQHDYKVKPELSLEIMRNPLYNEILSEFNGKPQNFVNKCEEFIKNMNNFSDSKPTSMEPQDGPEGLIYFIYEFIKTTGNILKDKAFLESFQQKNKVNLINNIVEEYINKENEYIEEIKEKIGDKQNKGEIKTLNKNAYNFNNNNNSNNIKTTTTIKKEFNLNDILLSSIEPIFIILMIFISYRLFNTSSYDIQTINYFNTKNLAAFDEVSSCNPSFLGLTSPTAMNNWIRDCYVLTYFF